jgi:hypothetical protein
VPGDRVEKEGRSRRRKRRRRRRSLFVFNGYYDDRAVYCSCQKQTSYTFRGYVLKRDVTKFQGYTLLAV